MTKRVTIRDVAKLAEVSVATVSYVVNGRSEEERIPKDTQKKVLQAINFLGYSPNAFAASLRSNSIRKVVLKTGAYPNFFEDIAATCLVRELNQIAKEHNFDISFSPDSSPEKLAYEACVCFNMPTSEFRALSGENFVPFIIVNGIINDPVFYQINLDFDALKAAADKHFETHYTYLAISPSCAILRQEIEDTFENVCFVSSLDDLLSISSKHKNILLSQNSLAKFSSLLPNYNILIQRSQTRSQVIFECIKAALNRTHVPDEAHFIRV